MNDLRTSNLRFIKDNKECMDSIQNLVNIEDFIENLDFLLFGRVLVFINLKYVFNINEILKSSYLSLSSCIECCKCGCFSDANILLRKYRDDLFFILYILVYKDSQKFGKTDEMEKNIEKWLNNNLSNLNISEVLKTIATSPNLSETVKKYKLKTYFDDINSRLNDYVHGNGRIYYNKNVNGYNADELISTLNKIIDDARYITTTFTFLLSLCSPYLISSTDYIDCLDLGISPTEGSQYRVAPFIENFFRNNIGVIDSNGIEYLAQKTYMMLSD